MIKGFFALIKVLPQILRLLETIERRNKERAVDRKVKEDIEAMNKAFEENDAEALNNIFRDQSI